MFGRPVSASVPPFVPAVKTSTAHTRAGPARKNSPLAVLKKRVSGQNGGWGGANHAARTWLMHQRRPSGCAQERRNKISRQTETETRTEKRDRSRGTKEGNNNKQPEGNNKVKGRQSIALVIIDHIAGCCHSTHMQWYRFSRCYCYRIHFLVQLYSVAYCFGGLRRLPG